MGADGLKRDDEVAKASDKYVKAKLEGKAPRECARIAGYSDKTKITDIERADGPVQSKLTKALAASNINETFLAEEYAKGIERSMSPGAKDRDHNAHAQYLKNLTFALGYGKTGPSVAVQINNSGQASGHELGRIEDSISEMRVLLDALRAEVGLRESAGVLEADTESPAVQAHSGVDEPGADGAEVAGGSGEGSLQE